MEPRADLECMYFMWSCTSSEEPGHCSIVTLPVLIMLFVERGSTTQLLLALQVHVHASIVRGILIMVKANKLLGLGA